jgi:serine/threonine-protein kinase RsbW
MLVLPSSPESIADVESLVNQLFEKYSLDEEHYPSVLVTITEAVNNAIYHGNHLDYNKKVKVNHNYRNGILTFNICDEGKGFDAISVPDPTCIENLEKCGGRGVYIMKELAHQLKFLKNGTEVEIIFRIESSLCSQS